MDEKLPENNPPDSITGEVFPKNLKELPKNEWSKVIKIHKRTSPCANSYEITFLSKNGNLHLVWGIPSMIERIKEYEKLQENEQHTYIKYIGLMEFPYPQHKFDSISY